MTILLKASKVVDGNSEIVMESGQIIIGRLPSNSLVVAGQGVEPIHAMIEHDPQSNEFSIIDMGSETGVKVNGTQIDVVKKIVEGDEIEIGGVIIQVLSPESADINYGEDEDPELISVKAVIPPPPMRATLSQKSQNQNSFDKIDMPTRTEKEVKSSAVTPEKRVVTVARVTSDLFKPGKETPSGSTLEVVAFWDQNILDVRHFGTSDTKIEEPLPSDVYIGNEEDGHMIGVGPYANTRNYCLAEVKESKVSINLNKDMSANVRRGSKIEKIKGPSNVALNRKESAIISHGPLSYFMLNVRLPNSNFKEYEDLDGKPIIFIYAAIVYLILCIGIYANSRLMLEKIRTEDEAWSQVFTVRTQEQEKKETRPPAAKPVVEVKPPAPVTPLALKTPMPTPAPKAEPPKSQTVAPVHATPPPKHVEVKNLVKAPAKPAPSKSMPNPKAKEDVGRINPKAAAPGNNGGPVGGTRDTLAGQRKGTSQNDMMGVENGKKDVMSGINFSELGKGFGKISNVDGIGAVASGLKASESGGEGGGAGSSARNAHGIGGLGNQDSVSTGGPAGALAGLGGGGGGMGRGGLGGKAGTGTGIGKKLSGQVVAVPEGDPVTEGNLTKEEVEAVIRANIAQIKNCYEKNLQGKRDLSGKIVTNFVINPQGRVTSADIASSELGHPPTESCIAGAIRRWKFPLPRGAGSVKVTYPFVFTPSM